METLLQHDRLNLGASDRPCRLSTPNLADLEQIRSERTAIRLAHDDHLKNSIAPEALIASKLGSYRDHVRPAFQFIPNQFGSAREMNGT
ncbi:hypothetical protein TRE132_26460 [Pseudomonas chlororaphis subsp. aurantiaca]|nr:hypothetical protein TRE132_26460 [Pseudomonas chlororaphis subsp. aurantiaca]